MEGLVPRAHGQPHELIERVLIARGRPMPARVEIGGAAGRVSATRALSRSK